MKIVFTLILLFTSLLTLAQKSIVKGYYITNANDSVTCFIDNKNWSINPKSILVYSSPNLTGKELKNMEDIKSFGIVNGDVFERFVTVVDKSYVYSNRINVETPPEIAKDTVFLKVLIKGTLNLYYLKDENTKEHLFIQELDKEPVELLVIKNKVKIEGATYIKKQPFFKETLLNFMKGCDATISKIHSIRYGAKNITKLVKQYNECTPNIVNDYVAPTEKVQTSLALLVGGFNTNIKFSGQGHEELAAGKFNGSGNTAGVVLNLVLPRLHKKWIISNELLWKSYNAAGDHVKYYSTRDYITSHSKIRMNGVGLNTILKYQFKNSFLTPYLAAGISNNYMSASKNEKISQHTFYLTSTEKEGKFLNDIRRFEQALIATVGANFKSLFLEIKYERGNGMSGYTSLNSTKSMIGIMVGYTLKK